MTKKLFISLFLIVLVTIFFWEIIFLNKNFIFRDMPRSYYPYKYFAAKTIKEGSLPLWNQYIACGIPFFASSNSGVFYPPAILYYILPFKAGFNIFYVIHYLLALIFMYLLARDFKFSLLSSLFASICFGLGGYFISILDTPSFTPATWVPLTFLLFRRSLSVSDESKKNIYTISTGLSLSMEMLNGDPIISYCTFIILLTYLIVEKAKFIYYLKLFLIFFMAAGISAIQLIPTIELFKLSDRIKLPYEIASGCPMPPSHLINLLVPFSFGDFTLTYTDWYTKEQMLLKSIYIGIFPLIFSFLIIVNLSKLYYKNKDRDGIFLSLILYISLFLILGNYTPVYKLFYNFIPGLSNMRFPVKFFFLTVFSIVLLAGKGMDYIIFTKEKKQPYIKNLIIIEIIIIILAFLIFFCKDQILSFIKVNFYKDMTLSDTIIFVKRANEIMGRILQMLAIFTSAIILISILKLNKISNSTFQVIVITVLIIDIFPMGMKLNPLGPADAYKEEENITFIKNNLGDKRIFYSPELYVSGKNHIDKFKNTKKSLVPDIGLIYGISDIEGHEAVLIKRHFDLCYRITKKGNKRISPLLDLSGVKYILTSQYLSKKFKFLQKDYIKIYENPDCLPRAFVINKAKLVKGEKEAFSEIMDPDFDPVSYVIIEYDSDKTTYLPFLSNDVGIKQKFDSEQQTIQSVIQPAEIKYLNPNMVSIEVSTDSDGYLVLTDTYYPGWKAYIDGKESKIYRAYYTFRAIKIDKGKHTVLFKYKPISFKIGLIITLIFLFIIVFFLNKQISRR